ncbi:hypothetical protein BKE30_01980 [Alkanindiges hydrocarboniclasticus]|uniref:DUF1289 domain-containing protein n=1 Tax=Alkanindiges hydrocarboniclasticus TaxID=1907941 RepID=A0A1S8CXF3_9GAMM|nr:hypothetical protein BKE30_01980 [Alkanindiges hydrocarboniclasticus]
MEVQLTAALTPCAGKCSTVFGDSVCRGCRRFSHEVIHWNRYSPEEQRLIWQRLDSQLDQILLPLVQIRDEQALDELLRSQQVRLLEKASAGRKIYHALRICQRNPACLERAGLNVSALHLQKIWQLFEQRIYSLAVASFELAWLRAAQFGETAAGANSL